MKPDNAVVAPRSRQRLGLTSFLVGSLSLAIGAIASYARRGYVPGRSSVILDWLAASGFVREYRRDVVIPIASEPALFSITDDRVIVALTVLAILSAGTAMALALTAEYRREHTLYLSAGYACAALTLTFYRPLYFILAMVAGMAVVMVMRHGRRRN